MGTIFVDNLEPQSGTSLTLGASGDTVQIASGVTNNLGISNAQMWRINTGTSLSADTETTVTSGWEEVDSDGYGRIGSVMSVSSGIWTFPQTGIYLINWNVQFKDPSQGATRATSIIATTTDNSTYATATDNSGNIYHSNGRSSVLASHIFDVTSTSTHKCKLNALCEFACTLHSATSQSRTWVQFIRLGDT